MSATLDATTAEQVRLAAGLVGLFVVTIVAALVALAAGAHVVPGWAATVVGSGSMAPALRPGDVVAYGAVAPDDVAPGAVVVFEGDDGRRLVHRVVGVGDEGLVTTKGDANAEADSSPVAAADIEGRGLVLVPFVGLARLWLEEGRWGALAATAAVLAAAAMAARWSAGGDVGPGVPAAPLAWLLSEPPAPGGLLDRGRGDR